MLEFTFTFIDDVNFKEKLSVLSWKFSFLKIDGVVVACVGGIDKRDEDNGTMDNEVN